MSKSYAEYDLKPKKTKCKCPYCGRIHYKKMIWTGGTKIAPIKCNRGDCTIHRDELGEFLRDLD